MAKKKVKEEVKLQTVSEAKEARDKLIKRLLAANPSKELNDTVESKLTSLYELQILDSEIDNITVLRGELPKEVENLEDEVIGLETRVSRIKEEIKSSESAKAQRKIDIESAKELIKKYEGQQEGVRNNREFESLAKEVEFQNLEIELCEKRIKESTQSIKDNKLRLEETKELLKERQTDLEIKKKELDDIVAVTEKEEKLLVKKTEEYAEAIDTRLMDAYRRLRTNARNGLAVVEVRRNSCGGCFNKIPPQRQADIRQNKRVIACEYCGRILVSWNEELELETEE